MREERDHSLQRLHSACWAPRQIQNERSATDTTDSTTQSGEGCFLRALAAHALTDSSEQAVADCGRRLRGNIAGSDARAAGGDDELHFASETDQQVLDSNRIVGNNFAGDDGEMKFLESPRHGGT